MQSTKLNNFNSVKDNNPVNTLVYILNYVCQSWVENFITSHNPWWCLNNGLWWLLYNQQSLFWLHTGLHHRFPDPQQTVASSRNSTLVLHGMALHKHTNWYCPTLHKNIKVMMLIARQLNHLLNQLKQQYQMKQLA